MPEITISHTVDIDKCLTKEISELNNKHNILTLYSCCGHNKGDYGYIVVHEFNEEDMVNLGYEKQGVFRTNTCGREMIYNTFRPKSACKGRC
jgi:hypothetical protein